MSFFSELKRRNVLRVGAAYIVTAWLIVQVVETLFPIYGLSDAAARTVVNILAIGLVPVLVLSWVFEWTPEGLKRDAEVDHDRAFVADSAKRLDRIILVVLALALGYFAFDKFVLDPARDVEIAETARQEGRSEAIIESYGEASIAVLALADLSPGADQSYLSDGIAEEILNLLAGIPGLRVISRSSAFSFKGRDIPIPDIAEKLNVAYVLEGSVRRSGDRIRITAQLIDGATDAHLWSRTFDRIADDIFAIQDDIASALVEQMQLTLVGPAPRVDRVDPDAYYLYLQAYHAVNTFDSERAARFFRQALEIEPGYPDALVGLSRAYYQQRESNLEEDPYVILSRQALDEAAEMDPDHPAVLSYSAWNSMTSGDYELAAEQFERAINRYPQDWDVLRPAMIFSSLIRRHDIAVALGKLAVTQDPYCAPCAYAHSQVLLNAGRRAEAAREIERFKALDPAAGGDRTLGVALLLSGQADRAKAVFEGLDRPLDRRYGLLLMELLAGSTAAEAKLEGFVEEFAESGFRDKLDLYAAAGKSDEAFEMLQEAASEASPWQLAGIMQSPVLDRLHADPRWRSLQQQAGIAPDQLAGIAFEPELPSQVLTTEVSD